MESSASVIGEGSYGCVHKPKLECNKSKKVDKLDSKKFISKFMLTKEALQEMSEYAMISHIDSKKKYYLGKPFKCKPKKNKYNLNSIKKCDIYKNVKNKLGTTSKLSTIKSFSKTKKNSFDKFSLLIIPDGGTDLSKLADSFSQMTVSEKKEILKKFWKDADNLFEGVIVFQKHDIIHHDIKPQNVLFNKDTGKLKFIDFGLMRKLNEVIHISKKSENYIAEYPFWTYPFEFPYLNYENFMKIAELSVEKKYEYYDDLVSKLHDSSSKISIACRVFFDYILHNMSEEERTEEIKKYFDDFMDTIIYEIVPDNYANFLEKSIHTIDLFGVGIILQFMLCYSEKIFDSKTIDLLKDCFFNMMRPSVSHRYTVQEGFQYFTEIMKKDKKKEVSIKYPLSNNFNLSNIKKLSKKMRDTFISKQQDILEKAKTKLEK